MSEATINEPVEPVRRDLLAFGVSAGVLAALPILPAVAQTPAAQDQSPTYKE